MDLSKNQHMVVSFLYHNPKLNLTSTQLAHLFNNRERELTRQWSNIFHTPSQLHSILSRLEKRGIVTRNKGIPGKWRLTKEARIAYGNDLEDRE